MERVDLLPMLHADVLSVVFSFLHDLDLFLLSMVNRAAHAAYIDPNWRPVSFHRAYFIDYIMHGFRHSQGIFKRGEGLAIALTECGYLDLFVRSPRRRSVCLPL